MLLDAGLQMELELLCSFLDRLGEREFHVVKPVGLLDLVRRIDPAAASKWTASFSAADRAFLKEVEEERRGPWERIPGTLKR